MKIRSQINRIAAVSAVAVAFFAGALAHAGETLVSKVPFEFTIGDKTFPAGEYQFQVEQLSPDTVIVRSTDRTNAAIAPSHRMGDSVTGGSPLVTFNVYGEQRFLSMIQTKSGIAVTIARGSKERALANAGGASSVALVSALRAPRS